MQSEFTIQELQALDNDIEKYRVEKEFEDQKGVLVRYFSVEAENKYLNDIGVLKGEGIKDDRFVDFQVYQKKLNEMWKWKSRKSYADKKLQDFYTNKGYGDTLLDDIKDIDPKSIPF